MKHVAAPRSVETLVDFSKGNLICTRETKSEKLPKKTTTWSMPLSKIL
jgi:hypothetical protein